MTTLADPNETSLYLLSPVIPADPFRKQLWGCLITNPTKPKDTFSSWRRKAPVEMIDDLDIDPQTIQDYGSVMEWARYGGTEMSVESIFKAYLDVFESEADFRKATYAEWYDMTAPQKQLERLLENPEWAADALAFIKDNDGEQLFFVTAMLVVAKLDYLRAQGNHLAGGLTAGAPNPQTGTNLIHVGVAGGTASQRIVAGRFVKPQILAIGYRPVKITSEVPEKQKNSWTWLRRLFGIKPKHRLVGQLYNDDKNLILRLNIGRAMARGTVHFMGDNEGDDEGGETSDAAAHQGISQVPPGGEAPEVAASSPLASRKIAIRSANAPYIPQ